MHIWLCSTLLGSHKCDTDMYAFSQVSDTFNSITNLSLLVRNRYRITKSWVTLLTFWVTEPLANPIKEHAGNSASCHMGSLASMRMSKVPNQLNKQEMSTFLVLRLYKALGKEETLYIFCSFSTVQFHFPIILTSSMSHFPLQTFKSAHSCVSLRGRIRCAHYFASVETCFYSRLCQC